MTASYTQCRYLRLNGDQCTGEALEPGGDVLVCLKHAARLLKLIKTKGVR